MNTGASSGRQGYFSSALRKILLTALVGGIAYLLTNLTDAPQVWQLTLSVFIGGVVLVVQFLVDFDDRLHVLEGEQRGSLSDMHDLVNRGFRRIGEATELFARVEAAPVRTESVLQLVRHSTEIPRAAPRLVNDLAQTEIRRLSALLKDLAKGAEITYQGEDRDWLIALTTNTQSSIDATSMTAVDAGGKGFDGGFWNTDLGRRYLELQRGACDRGVRVRRIFILDRPELAGDPDFDKMCAWQASIGIEVRVLRPEVVTEPWKAWLQDFIVFDDALSYETLTTPRIEPAAQPTYVSTRLVLDPTQVRERRERYQDLWKAAAPFVPADLP